MSDKVIIFDTTLRDGEQCPGASMNLREKMEIARQLQRLNVDVIEAGFPVISDGDFEAVQKIATEIRGPIIAGLARCVPGDIDAAGAAVKPAGDRARIHVFLATSKIHRDFKLKKPSEEIIRLAVESVKRAKAIVHDVEFSPEDASRTEPEFLGEVVEAAIEAGATTVNIPDTVGYAVPAQFGDLIKYLKSHVKRIDDAVISVHCHNDLGMAVANSIAVVQAGARQIEGTVNGIGERAGNAAIEEIVMAIRTRSDYFKGFHTEVNAREIVKSSRLVSRMCGLIVARSKAIVGENAFAHSSGIHQDGILKHRETYEIMRPEDVGVEKTQLVLGKHSGKHALRDRLKSLGYECDDAQVEEIFPRFKALADKKKEVFDSDLDALVLGQDPAALGPWTLEQLHATSHLGGGASASVRLRHEDGRSVGETEGSLGDGPVHAMLRAIERATGTALDITDFQIRSLSYGADAQGRATLTVNYAGRELIGRGVSTDIVEATAFAALEVVNRIERIKLGQGLPLVAKSA